MNTEELYWTSDLIQPRVGVNKNFSLTVDCGTYNEVKLSTQLAVYTASELATDNTVTDALTNLTQ